MDEEPQVFTPQEERVRKQHRMVIGTSFVLLLLLVGAMWLKIITPPFSYVLFALIFIVDFGAQGYLIWMHRLYWVGGSRVLRGLPALIIAAGYGFMCLVCIAFAIYTVNVYYF